ncbi:DNA-directed RNA polymerase III subunit RPC1 [Xylaria cubensis]|nr:DNA-directed RNA polymerase III subunit RPC1 [Xylaria cubensis]
METIIETSAAAPAKHQVVDKLPKQFKTLKFGIQSNQDIVNQSVLDVSDRSMYDIDKGREPTVNGVLDKRLGTSSKTGACATCNERLAGCIGHFGHVRLPLPAFHIGYIKFTITILQNICKDCSKVLRLNIDNMKRCRKTKQCPYCGAVNGQIRKVGALKLSTSAKKQPPPKARKHTNDLDKHMKKAFEDLNPLKVLNLFKQITSDDCELLGLNLSKGRPEMFLWQYLPAPPVCIRPDILQIAVYVNIIKTMRRFCGNLTVISPDPNLAVNEVAVPVLAILKANGDHPPFRVSLRFSDKEAAAKELCISDVIKRYLEDGDIVRPWRTFRLNECACGPYNADFDEEARAEAVTLMSPIIAATQDFITGSYLLSSKDMFFDRRTFTYIVTHMTDGVAHLDLLPPAILIFSMLMRPNKSTPVKVNLDAKCKGKRAPDMCPNDGWLVVWNSEVMCGRMDKSTVGSGQKDSIFYVILQDYGPDAAVTVMNRLAKLCARMLTNRGFSIGIGDLFENAYNKLQKATKCSIKETLEAKISGMLNKVRQNASELFINSLSRNNAPLVMASSGSKGSNLNIIAGSRVANSFQDRTLPHFHKNTRHALAKSFVQNSFYTGLIPTEFLFHAISRQKGYMSRRLIKSLEDLSTKYNNTFQFGADKLNPVDIEGKASNINRALLPFEILALYNSMLKKERDRYRKRGILHGEPLIYNDTTDYSVDKHESGRNFLETIHKHVRSLAERFTKLRVAAGLNGMLTTPDTRSLPLTNNEREALATLIFGIEQARVKQLARLKTSDEHQQPRKLVQIKPEVDELTYEDLLNLKPVLEELDFQRPSKTKSTIKKQEFARLSELNTRLNRLELGYLARLACRTELQKHGHVSKIASERAAKVSKKTLRHFIRLCLKKYNKAHVEPGHAVSAVSTQSISKPGTQMTLKTFHFAGVAGISITQGVPRIKEIINASKTISTPVITCPLQNPRSLEAAKIVQARIKKTYVKDVLRYLDNEWQPHRSFITLHINTETLESMHLGIKLGNIVDAIAKQKKLKIQKADMQIFEQDASIEITVRALNINPLSERTIRTKTAIEAMADLSVRISQLRRILPSVPIFGYPEATRAIIQQSDKDSTNTVLVEGYGLRQCINTEGVVGSKVTSNSVIECSDVLGIEAARTTIIKEISNVMGLMNIDPRHMQLLADVMTYKGEILGITRFGLSKMRDSVLQLASFEKTADHLFDAASGMKTDPIEGVSEKIIMGETISIGTGAFDVVRRLNLLDEHLATMPMVFENAWLQNQKDKLAKRTRKRGH